MSRREITHRATLAGMLLAVCLAAPQVRAGEPAEYTKEKIDALIKDLGNDEFEKRQTAEKELVKAGVKAQTALNAALTATDPQIKASAGRIMGRIKLANLGPVNYLDVLPGNTLVGIELTNIKAMVEGAKTTAVGKVIASPELAPFRAKVEAEINKNPEAWQQATKWAARFQGQVAVALWELNLAAPDSSSFGAMAEITDPDPVAVYRELLDVTQVEQMGGQAGTYKDIATLTGPNGQGALALVGKHLVVASNLGALQKLIDGILTPAGGFGASPAFLKIKPQLGPRQDLLLMVDFQAYLKLVTAMMPGPGMEELMTSSGAGDMQLMVMGSAVSGDGFEDRFVAGFKGVPKGFAAISIPPPAGPVPLEVTALMPANAVAAAVSYLDGTKTQTALTDYLAAFKKVMDVQRGMGGQAPDIDAKIKEVEAKLGVKLADLVANLKGEIGYWTELASPPTSAWPNLGLLLTCVDADKAKATAGAIAKIVNTVTGKPAVQEVPLGARTLYQVDLVALAAVPPNFQYTPCWSTDGNRVFFASSVPALKKQLNNLDNKAPGLMTQPEFIKALGLLGPEERKGQVIYADMKSLLTLAATVGLPLLGAQIPDEELKKALAALPQPQELFKNIPALLCSSVLKGDQALTIIRGPLPPVPTLLGVGIGAGVLFTMPHAQVPANFGQ